MAGKEDMTRAERIFVRISILQTVLAVAGMFTGAVALWAALNESDAVRKQQQAAVWPRIDIAVTNNSVDAYPYTSVSASNNGIGPARVQYIAAYVDAAVQNDWWRVMEATAGVDGGAVMLSNADLNGRVLAAGETRELVRVDSRAMPEEAAISSSELRGLFSAAVDEGRVKLAVCYCSVFDDCWLAETDSGVEPVMVDACPAKGDENF
ncbi:MAG: hypothetical protein AAGC56_08825 [Pseudomonadota bacterium]